LRPFGIVLLITCLLPDQYGVGCSSHRDEQMLRRERLGHVIPATLAQRLDARLDAGVAGHHDDDRVRVRGQGRTQQGKTVDLGHVQVHERDVEGSVLEQV